MVNPSSDVEELVLVNADHPRPRLVLAVAALVAPVPPLEMAIVPVTLEANATDPTIFAAVIFVTPDALPFVDNFWFKEV